MGTNCAPLLADMFCSVIKKDFMMSLSEEKQSEVIEALSSTSRYLTDLLNFDKSMVSLAWPAVVQLLVFIYSDIQ